MMAKFRGILLFAGALALLPRSAFANAGTPLMWAALIHLAAGNAVLGILEGSLISRLYKTPRARTIWVMVAANYFSAWVGGVLIRGAATDSARIDLTNAWTWYWILAGCAWLFTVVLEWPFVAFGFRGTAGWFARSVRASLGVQTVSYLLLFGWYWIASATSLYSRVDIVSASTLELPDSVAVYYIHPTDGDVYRRLLAGGVAQKVRNIGSQGRFDRIIARRAQGESGRVDIAARLDVEGIGDARYVPVLSNQRVEAALEKREKSKDGLESFEGTWFNFGEAPRLGSAARSGWTFNTGFWAAEGIRAYRGRDKNVRVAYETPFRAWMARNATHLPGNKALFQFGDDQICVFDPIDKKVALLWHGRGPVAVIESGQ